jgi:hypothetical protein
MDARLAGQQWTQRKKAQIVAQNAPPRMTGIGASEVRSVMRDDLSTGIAGYLQLLGIKP